MTDAPRMHDDEVTPGAAVVRGLVAAQFPQWAALEIASAPTEGTDHLMYRLGPDMVVRLPRRPSAVAALEKERTWLPRLGRMLPTPVPTPIARGAPGGGYPWPWSVCRWIEGQTVTPERPADMEALARDLAELIQALQAIDVSGAPRPGAHNFGRGAPLARWNATIQERMGWLADLDQIAAIRDAWEADAGADPSGGPPVWIHGDLSGGNLLVREGRLCGVIDWSCLAAGDPACELQVAWSLFDQDARRAFRSAMGVDEATWIRGRAWGLAMGVLNVSYYRTRNAAFTRAGWRAIEAVLADRGRL
jgi:aminoglycoside phosphotransferase (APT) family kinase protein